MKNEIKIDHNSAAEKKGRKVSAAIHLVILGLLAFPFLQMTNPESPKDIQIVMDFSSGSSNEGAKTISTAKMTPKAVDLPKPKQQKPVKTAKTPEKVVIKETPTPKSDEVTKPQEDESDAKPEESIDNDDTDSAQGKGAGEEGSGDAAEGNSASGNGKGFIEGTGALTRAVIDRGNTKALAQQNGTLILKICINRRGVVTFAEWDKEASSIKNSEVARIALDNVLKYKFEKDRSAPSKECGRLTYIIDVD